MVGPIITPTIITSINITLMISRPNSTVCPYDPYDLNDPYDPYDP